MLAEMLLLLYFTNNTTTLRQQHQKLKQGPCLQNYGTTKFKKCLFPILSNIQKTSHKTPLLSQNDLEYEYLLVEVVSILHYFFLI